LSGKLEATRSLINEIKEDLEAYKSIHAQIEHLIQKSVFYRNERYIESLMDAEG
jgi:hypothetical protein